MAILNEAQTELAIKMMHEFLSSPADPASGKTLVEDDVILDKDRRELIEKRLAPAVQSFLSGAMPLTKFKPEIDGLNKQHTFWGFSGIKGQMFFNQLYNCLLYTSDAADE